MDGELPTVSAASVNQLDSKGVMDALARVDEVYKAPVALFYLRDCSYKEIADILDIPMGTVKSRIARGIAQLHTILSGTGSARHKERHD